MKFIKLSDKPMALNIISVLIIGIGLIALLQNFPAISKMSEICRNFNATPSIQVKAGCETSIIISMVTGIMGLLSGILLFLGKETGRKLFFLVTVFYLIFIIFNYGVRFITASIIPVIILFLLYAIKSIRDFFSKDRRE